MTIELDDLERELAALGERIDAAHEPRRQAMVDSVLERIDATPRERGVADEPGRRWLAAAAAIVLLGGLLAVPGVRRTVGRWLGFDSVRIERPTGSSSLPAATFPPVASTVTTATVTPSPAPYPTLRLGPALSAAEARARTGLPVPTSARLGAGTVFATTEPTSVVVVVSPSADLPRTPVAGVGALLSTLPGEIQSGYLLKVQATFTEVDVRTASGATVRGLWLGGTPHQIGYVDHGEFRVDTLRLATNTLLWQVGDVVYRLESGLTMEQAMQVAATVTVVG